MKKDAGLHWTEKKKKRTENREILSELILSWKHITVHMYDCNPYTVYIFVITALIHCTLCRDGSHTFVSFQTVICFCDRVNYENISLDSVLFFPVPRQPYIMFLLY